MASISRSLFVPAALIAVVGCSPGPAQSGPATCDLAVGPEVQISKEDLTTGKTAWFGGRPFLYELQLGQNPKDPNNFIASGIFMREAADSLPQEVLAFRSTDGGKTWEKTPLPPFPLDSGKKPFAGDPTFVFSKAGTAMYLTYTKPNMAHLSTDRGKTWSEPVAMTPAGLDHWMVAGDYTNGPYGGWVYAWGMGTVHLGKENKDGPPDYNFIQYQMRLLRTKDEGKTWTDKLALTNEGIGIKGHGLNSVSDVLVDRKGKLYLPFHSWDNVNDNGDWGQWMTASNDGGETFVTPYRVKKADGSLLMGRRSGSYPGYALDVTTGPFQNRLYAVWMDSTAATGGRWQLLFSTSDDSGVTFAEPKVLEDSLTKIDQMHPDLRVNKDGVLAVAYYRFKPEGPDSTTKEGRKLQDLTYNRYVTASLDGGKTFLPAKPLSSTMYRSPASYDTTYGWGLNSVRFGDYFNVVAGPDGVFHTIWMGGVGPTQMWFGSIRVRCGG